MAPRILIFGTGSLGACYAWVLSRVVPASHITAVCRSNFAEAARDGFTIHSGLWGENLRFRPRVARSVADAVQQLRLQEPRSDPAHADQEPFFDYVVVAAKAVPTTPSAAEIIEPAVSGGKTAIVLLQNGIGVEEPFAARFGPATPILSTVAYFPATRTAPTVVRHTEVERLHVGTYPASAGAESKEAAARFVGLLQQAGATALLHEDVQRERWAKLLVNASWNPVRGGGDDDALSFVKDVMLEIAAVAQTCGYADVDEKLVDYQIGRAAVRQLPGVQPSMLADVMDGRGLEVDAIVGNVVRLARKKGVPVPMLRTIYMLVNGLSQSVSRR
ncbi:hypothetical protein AAE478_003948 [Parahypoxylon ruwenzoriense]